MTDIDVLEYMMVTIGLILSFVLIAIILLIKSKKFHKKKYYDAED